MVAQLDTDTEKQYQPTTQSVSTSGEDVLFSIVSSILPEFGLLFEVDGYRHHGLSKTGFKRDREKDRLAILHGFVVIRFFHSELIGDTESVREYLHSIKKKRFEKDPK